jgi:hypothetical protein
MRNVVKTGGVPVMVLGNEMDRLGSISEAHLKTVLLGLHYF